MNKLNVNFRYSSLLIILLSFVFLSCKSKDDGIGDPDLGSNTDSSNDGGDQGSQITKFQSLNFLYEISGKKTIGGIHNREPNAQPHKWTDEVFDVAGVYPGMWSGDFLYQQENIDSRQTMVDEAVNQWNQGALVQVMWHACNPKYGEPCGWDDGKGVLSRLSNEEWDDLFTEGTAIHTRWIAMVDEVADYLLELQNQGVEVLWRPIHEMNQESFWWGGRSGTNGTAKLFRELNKYLTKKKGLHNLIWVWDLQDFGNLSDDVNTYNPGSDYWDVIALDVYGDGGFSKSKYDIIKEAAGNKPMGIGECQKLPTPSILADQPRWSFFMGWSELVFESNSDSQIKAAFLSPRVLSLDEMPGWNN